MAFLFNFTGSAIFFSLGDKNKKKLYTINARSMRGRLVRRLLSQSSSKLLRSCDCQTCFVPTPLAVPSEGRAEKLSARNTPTV